MAFSEQPLRRLDPQLGSKCHVVVNSDCDSPHFGLHSPQVQPSESIGITIRPGEMSTWVSNTCEEPGLFQMARSELLAWPTRRDRQSGCLIILGLVSDRCRTAKLSPSSSLVKSESDDVRFTPGGGLGLSVSVARRLIHHPHMKLGGVKVGLYSDRRTYVFLSNLRRRCCRSPLLPNSGRCLKLPCRQVHPT